MEINLLADSLLPHRRLNERALLRQTSPSRIIFNFHKHVYYGVQAKFEGQKAETR